MKRNVFQIDWWLLVPVFILIAISLTTLSTININYLKSQAISLVIAIFVFFFFSKINLDFFKKLKLPIYIISLVLLTFVLFIGIESRGAVRWVEIFGISIQFSEILKPFLALSFATFIAESTFSKKKTFFLSILLLLPVFLLISLQPDLGSGLIYAFTGIFVLLIVGFPIFLFLLSLIPVFLSFPFIWTLLHEYQKQRILTLIQPASDPLGTSYNSIQAIITVGSGMFWGRGLFEGTQSALRFLPERHTDFIFATIAEGLGFIGSLFTIFIFTLLVYRIYVIFKNAENSFSRIFSACCFGFFFMQGFINIAMNIGLLPIVGITLPFVSYGGNSLISNFVFLGILSAINKSQKTRHALEIR
jgi:rod shape determining protein RodA